MPSAAASRTDGFEVDGLTLRGDDLGRAVALHELARTRARLPGARGILEDRAKRGCEGLGSLLLHDGSSSRLEEQLGEPARRAADDRTAERQRLEAGVREVLVAARHGDDPCAEVEAG